MLPPTVLAALGTRLCAVRGAWAWRLRAEQLAGKRGWYLGAPRHVPDAYAPSRPARSRLPASGVPEPQQSGLGPRLTATVRPFLVRRSLAAGKGPPMRTSSLGFLGERAVLEGGNTAGWIRC